MGFFECIFQPLSSKSLLTTMLDFNFIVGNPTLDLKLSIFISFFDRDVLIITEFETNVFLST